MDLNEINVFARVVQAGSFTGAAEVLGMPKSTVSRKVTQLEKRLDARLLQRTTRKLNLTDAGRTYYDYAARIVAELDEAERAVSTLQSTPQGLLRVTAPVNAAYLGALVSDYLRRYPRVQLEMFCTSRTVDLVEERFDVGIRAGLLSDSTLIARPLGNVTWFFVATPAYLKKRGRPKAPGELSERDVLIFGSGTRGSSLTLESAEATAHPTVSPRLLVTDMDVLVDAVRSGLGIGLLPAYLCAADLRAKRLERVLREWSVPVTPVQVVYPSTRHVSPKVKTFVDHLLERMTPPPWGFL